MAARRASSERCSLPRTDFRRAKRAAESDFSLLSYNVLCWKWSDGRPYAEPYLDWQSYRLACLRRELEEVDADVVCLQECDFETIEADLQLPQYTFVMPRKAKARGVGNVTLVRSDLFEVVWTDMHSRYHVVELKRRRPAEAEAEVAPETPRDASASDASASDVSSNPSPFPSPRPGPAAAAEEEKQSAAAPAQSLAVPVDQNLDKVALRLLKKQQKKNARAEALKNKPAECDPDSLRRSLYVINCHLPGNPIKGLERVEMVLAAVNGVHHRIHRLAEADAAVVMSGDFNSEVDGGCYKLLLEGSLPDDFTEFDQPIRNVGAPHLRFECCYQEHRARPQFTFCMPNMRLSWIDFVLHSRNIDCRAVLEVASQGESARIRQTFLPNRDHASDHLPVGAIFRFENAIV